MSRKRNDGTPSVTALAPWFGSNRNLADQVGALLGGQDWVGVPFAGGMCELLHIKAATVLVSDLHAHVLNLASVVADPELNAKLRERLDALPFHPDVLAWAQYRCIKREAALDASANGGEVGDSPRDLDWAADYFLCSWMGRNGKAGTAGEFNSRLSVRWCAGGGDSAMRFRNATESLAAWQKVMRRCTFVRRDVFDFLDRAPDEDRHALYLDPPFPGPGEEYKYTFGEEQQRMLASHLAAFERTRIVVRFYDHPLVRELYPDSGWAWHVPVGGRKQTNEAAPEVLLVKQATGDHFPGV